MKPESHEYADMFPMLEGKELQSLADDIKSNGQNEPIIIYDGKILDGRNRYAACELAGVEPITRNFDGTDALSFVISQNLHRRHLTITQRAMMAEKVANMRAGGDRRSDKIKSSKDNLIFPDRKTRQQAAVELDVSEPSLDRARSIRKHGVPELVDAVESNKITVTRAAKIAKLPPEDQSGAMKEPAPKPRPQSPSQPESPQMNTITPRRIIRTTPEGKLSELAHQAANILRNVSIPSKAEDIAKVETIIEKIKTL